MIDTTEPTEDQALHDATAHDHDMSDDTTELAQLRDEVAKYKELYIRALADYDNAKRNMDRERRELRDHAAEHMIVRMLPVLDDLHSAIEHSKTSSDAEALRTGIEMIYAKAVRIFEDAGLRPIDVEPGHPFNVDVHEALMHMPSDHPEGHVVQVVQRGYQLHDKVLRHTKVITSAGQPSSEA